MSQKDENQDNPNSPSTEEIMRVYETVYVFRFLVKNVDESESNQKNTVYPLFGDEFKKKELEQSDSGN